MISLQQLITIAPFPEQSKKQLTDALPTYSDDKKFELMEMCWALISKDYQNKLQFKFQSATLEMAEGKKTYSKEDFKKMEDDLFDELVEKLQVAEDQIEIANVREKLKAQTPPKTS